MVVEADQPCDELPCDVILIGPECFCLNGPMITDAKLGDLDENEDIKLLAESHQCDSTQLHHFVSDVMPCCLHMHANMLRQVFCFV